MKILCQRNPKWSTIKMGSSKLTLGKFGCTTTCISMLSDYFGCYRSPEELAHNANNYTKSGLVIWQNIIFNKMSVGWREYKRDDKKIQEYLKDPNKAVILQVDNGSHWIVALRPTILGKDYVCADPWTGKKCLAIKDYHNITGATYFHRI